MAWVQPVINNSIYTMDGKRLFWENMFKLEPLKIKHCEFCGIECYRLTKQFPYREVRSNLWVEWDEDKDTVLCYKCWSDI